MILAGIVAEASLTLSPMPSEDSAETDLPVLLVFIVAVAVLRDPFGVVFIVLVGGLCQ
jgi:hypothetical protein